MIYEEKKLLKWLKNDYLTASYPTIMRISETFKFEVTFQPTWSIEKIDSLKLIQDSINQNLQSKKVEICSNNYWNSNTSKQVIPFYAAKLNCSTFFERPNAIEGIYEVEYEYGIPRFISIDDKISTVQQITALTLGIRETCFTCRCGEN